MQHRGLLAGNVVIALLITGCAKGQTELTFTIERDGKKVLEGHAGPIPASIVEDPPAMWRKMNGKVFLEVGPIKPEKDDAKEVVLAGKIRITVSTLMGRGAIAAEVTELRLERAGDAWLLPPEEVERTARVAGL